MELVKKVFLAAALIYMLQPPVSAQTVPPVLTLSPQPPALAPLAPGAKALALYGCCFCNGYNSKSHLLNIRHWLPSSTMTKEELNRLEKKTRLSDLAISNGYANCFITQPGQSEQEREQLKEAASQGFIDGELGAVDESEQPFYRSKDPDRFFTISVTSFLPHYLEATYRYGEKLKMQPFDVQDEITRFLKLTNGRERLREEPTLKSPTSKP